MRSLKQRIEASIQFAILLSLCSGCATGTLWGSKHGIRAVDVLPGTAEQVYMSFERVPGGQPFNEARAFPQYAIPYQLQIHGNHDLAVFRDKGIKGFLIVRETGSYYSQTDIESLMSRNVARLFGYPIDVESIYATTFKDGSQWWLDLPFSIIEPGFVLPVDDFFVRTSRIKQLERIPPILDSHKYMVVESDHHSVAQNHTMYNNSLCCYQSSYDIVTEYDVSAWTPLLPSDKVPLSISVYVMDHEKIYNNTLLTRLFVTPFALAADIVTFPIQLVLFATMDKWMPK